MSLQYRILGWAYSLVLLTHKVYEAAIAAAAKSEQDVIDKAAAASKQAAKEVSIAEGVLAQAKAEVDKANAVYAKTYTDRSLNIRKLQRQCYADVSKV